MAGRANAAMKPNALGQPGEDYAAKALEDSGYRILRRNFSCRFGEIDIIAAKGDIIAFVEVKTRRPGGMVSGVEAVTPAKQRRIVAAAMIWMKITACDLQPRFDIISVVAQDGMFYGHDCLEGAFDTEAYDKKYN
jgi:putative endonuclease